MIENKLSGPERNPITHRVHRREVFWQITLPLIIGAGIVLAFAVAVSFGGTQEVSTWSDISLIWLIIPVLLVSLLFLVILAGLVYAVTWLLGTLPSYAYRAQNVFSRIDDQVRKGADKAVEPVLRIHSFFAAWRALRRR